MTRYFLSLVPGFVLVVLDLNFGDSGRTDLLCCL